MKKSAAETRQHILDVAKSLMTSKGYTAVGLNEVVSAAGVPKGSFYYYFKSKEEFGQALLEEYFSAYLQTVDALLTGPAPAATRLMAYFRYWAETQGADLPEAKCLVVKLGAEVCDSSEEMRITLQKGTQAIIGRLVQCIEQGSSDQSVSAATLPQVLAESLYQLWLGASLLAKLNRQTAPFDAALETTARLLS